MKLLADENLDRPIVEWLRAQRHDVLYAAEFAAGYLDDNLLRIAKHDKRVLITVDLDFGTLVYHLGLASEGVVLIRLRSPSVAERLTLFRQRWPDIERALPGNFVLVSPHRIRIRPLVLPPG